MILVVVLHGDSSRVSATRGASQDTPTPQPAQQLAAPTTAPPTLAPIPTPIPATALPTGTEVPVAPATPGTYSDSQTKMSVSIDKSTLSSGENQFNSPKTGNVWALYDVTVTNNGVNAADYNPFDFKAVDDQGQTYNAMVTLENSAPLDAGSIPPGEFRSGWIGFEVPQSTSSLLITWDDAFHLSPPAELERFTLGSGD